MRKNTLFLLVAYAVISLQAECGKNEPNVVVPNDTTFLSYWFFPENSYWIYKDSVNHELDTFIIDATTQYFNEGNHDNTDWEFHAISVINRNNTKAQVGRPREYDGKQFIYFLDQSWSGGESAVRFFYTRDNSVSHLEHHLFQEHYDSLRINGVLYTDIYRMYNKSTQAQNDTVRVEYYARNIGVVKRVYASGRVWELEHYYLAH